MSIILAIVALSFLIIIHELGHFTVAKLSDIKVHEFSLFMGPKLFSKQIGETTYSLRAIPLGGYVRMEGEEQASDDSRAFNKKSIRVRMAVIAAGPLSNIVVALLLLFIAISFNGYNTTIVDKLQTDSPAYQAGVRTGDKIIKYGGKSIINPGDIDLFVFGGKGKPAEIQVQRGKSILKPFDITPEIISENRYLLGFTPKGDSAIESITVASVETQSEAYKVGLRQNDIIKRLNGKEIENGRDIRDFLKSNMGEKIDVTVFRNGIEQPVLHITPIRGVNREAYDTGLYFKHMNGNVVDNFNQSVISSCSISRSVYYSLTWLISGKVSINEMTGPVGIVSTMGDVVQSSPTFSDKVLSLLGFTAFISINLGLFNLIPFPALDGSKLILLAIEAIRRKALPPEREALISLVGLALLIMLMLYTTFHDVLRLTGKG